jgi:sulfite reductase alpha subunit-like flavoprotein
VWIAKGVLRLPPPQAPLILVCTGSGVAPFRSFVQERAAQRAAMTAGPDR